MEFEANQNLTDNRAHQTTIEFLNSALTDILNRFFGADDESFLALVRSRVVFRYLEAGDVLLKQGELSDDLYFVLSGRLRAIQAKSNAKDTVLGEIGRGETIGELALILGEPRSASIIALRDSILASLTKVDFETIIKVHPRLALSLARGAIQRMRLAERRRGPPEKPVTICVLPIDPTVDALAFSKDLQVAREKYDSPIRLIANQDTQISTAQPNFADHRAEARDWLTALESSANAIILVADLELTPWTDFCVHHSDEILLLANFDSPPRVTATEKELFDGANPVPIARQTLVLLHPTTRRSPVGTRRWLDRRTVYRHFHIRFPHEPDLFRLARILGGRAVGIVLAGGGARSFVHFGALNALAARGIFADFIGGTSMGAAVGALNAMGLTGERLLQAGRDIFLNKPTSDLNPIPILSFLRGRRVQFLTEQAILNTVGELIDVEDTWIPFFCIATNLSASEETVLSRGSLDRSLLATFAIPGALPPVLLDEQLMIDGATFNNFPVDVMENLGVGTIIGIAYSESKPDSVGTSELPGTFELIRNLFRPRHQRKFKLPTLPEILMKTTVVASTQRQKRAAERVDLMIELEVAGVNLLDWNRIDEIAARAEHETEIMLKDLPPELLKRLQ